MSEEAEGSREGAGSDCLFVFDEAAAAGTGRRRSRRLGCGSSRTGLPEAGESVAEHRQQLADTVAREPDDVDDEIQENERHIRHKDEHSKGEVEVDEALFEVAQRRPDGVPRLGVEVQHVRPSASSAGASVVHLLDNDRYRSRAEEIICSRILLMCPLRDRRAALMSLPTLFLSLSPFWEDTLRQQEEARGDY